MAISSSKKPLSLLPLVAFIAIHLMLFHNVHSADSTFFSFTRFNRNQMDLILQGDASVESKSNHLHLTSVDNNGNPLGGSVGRVLHTVPVHLHDSSALVTSFETTFTFSISSPHSNTPGDGLAFFLAPPDTTIPPGSGGALLGLFSSANAINNTRKELVGFKHSSSEKVVAVEFDTYPNTNIGDPEYRHIGIDINSIKSSAVGKWNWQDGDVATAHISYNSACTRLSVAATYPNASPVIVNYDVDLNDVLPEWVRVGFSAATGQHSQTNKILSWSFRSELTRYHVEEDEGYIASVV